MNKKALYESIMTRLSKYVKQMINEAYNDSEDDILSWIPSELLFEDEGEQYINLRDLKSLPKELTDKLIEEIMEKGQIDFNGWTDNMVNVFYYIDMDKYQDNIILRSADYFEVTINAQIEMEGSPNPGMESHDRDVPDDPFEVDIENTIWNAVLSDGGNTNVFEIKDPVIKDNIVDDFECSSFYKQCEEEVYQDTYDDYVNGDYDYYDEN